MKTALAILVLGLALVACAPSPAPAPQSVSTSSSTLPDCDTVPANLDADPWNDEPCHPTDPVWNQPVVAKDPPPPVEGLGPCELCGV